MSPDSVNRHLGAYIILIIILVILAGFAEFVRNSYTTGFVQQQPVQQSSTTPPPPPTAADVVSAQTAFQYLVSYTDRGFEPSTLTVKKDQTVRFTDNSSGSLQISFAGVRSPALGRGQYWQYTFDNIGTVRYGNAAGGGSGSVTVK